MTCDEYQIAFDQLAAGASAPIAQAEVDAHVAGCPACSAYVAMTRKVKDSMMTSVAAAQTLEVRAMHAVLDRTKKQLARWRILAPIMFAALWFGTQILIAGANVRAVAISAVACGVLYAFACEWVRRRRLRELTVLEAKTGEAFISSMRAELDVRMRGERHIALLLPFVLVAYHAVIFLGLGPAAGGGVILDLAYLGMTTLAVLRYRRTKRERALLG